VSEHPIFEMFRTPRLRGVRTTNFRNVFRILRSKGVGTYNFRNVFRILRLKGVRTSNLRNVFHILRLKGVRHPITSFGRKLFLLFRKRMKTQNAQPELILHPTSLQPKQVRMT